MIGNKHLRRQAKRLRTLAARRTGEVREELLAIAAELERRCAPSRRHWTPEETATLVERYPDTPTADLAKLFERPEHQVREKARKLGLRKSEAFMQSHFGGRFRGGSQAGKDTRFRKGNKPWNAGLKGWVAGGRSAETRFKPGRRGNKYQPIGTERIAGGYRQRKVSDTGYPPRDWVAVHRLLWEGHNGPVPPGHALVFRDGNPENIVIENLECITRQELMRRNSVHNLPSELVEVIRLKGVLRRHINKRTKHEKQDG